ncbi:MAG: ClpXP protease specificity-enhancing factor SspB [Pseudomonadota bacterium]
MSNPAELNYGMLMQRAMLGLLRDVLGIVAEHGLDGEHHFYISFDTTHPGVDIADWLHETYPEEMTIVLQHEYWDLAVMGDRFQVTLTFRDQPETLVIPLDAVTTFVDPSVEFGLKFDGHEAGEAEMETLGDESNEPQTASEQDDDTDPDAPGPSAEVVSLDRFRKH